MHRQIKRQTIGMVASQEIIHAYRHLYRSLLRAVQYSRPGRDVARDQLRAAFREKGATYDETGIKRTRWFLEAAGKQRGLEHSIVKNLLRVRSMRHWDRKSFKLLVTESQMK